MTDTTTKDAPTSTTATKRSKKQHDKSCSYDFKNPFERKRIKGAVQFRFKTKFRNTIYDTLRKRPNFRYTDTDMDWDIFWCERDWMAEWYDQVHLEPWQRVNHFRNGRELCRKDLMYRNIKKFRRRLEREKKHELAAAYDFVPSTFIMPADYSMFVEEFKRRPSVTWIMKPVGKAQGKGIFLFKRLSEISEWRNAYKRRLKMANNTIDDDAKSNDTGSSARVETYVAQCYLSKPYLIGGKKFDMRLYALVTSFRPLKCWIYRKGFARFSASRYEGSDLKNTSIHLTNVAVQKHTEQYNRETGGKWSLGEVKRYIEAKHGQEAANRAFEDMQSVMIRALEAVAGVMQNDKQCFELYGYDIMFDSSLKPWLLEVNASPSLTANTRTDYNLKFQMLNEMLDIVDLERHYETRSKLHVGGFDMVYDEKEINPYPGSIYKTLLGAEVPDPLLRFRTDGGSSAMAPTAHGHSRARDTKTTRRARRK